MNRLLAIDPREALAHGLPPMRLRLDLTGVPMMERRFPDPHTYFTMSGPPGGPLYLALCTLPGPVDGPGGMEQAVRVRLQWAEPMQFGPRGEVTVRGVRHPAVYFMHGEGCAATIACAVHLSTPAGGSGAPGLLLVFGHDWRSPDAPEWAGVARHPAIAPVLARLEWEAGGGPQG